MNTITRDSHYTTCSGSAEPQEKFHKVSTGFRWMPPGSTSPGSTPAPHSVRHSDFASGQFDAICRHDGHNQAESLGAFRGRVTDSLAPLEVTREHGDRDATFGARMTPIATYDTYDTSRPYTRGRDEEFRSLLDGFPRTRSISPNAVARGSGYGIAPSLRRRWCPIPRTRAHPGYGGCRGSCPPCKTVPPRRRSAPAPKTAGTSRAPTRWGAYGERATHPRQQRAREPHPSRARGTG